MGRHFGDLSKIRHVVTYSISPFEQRAFPSYFSKGIPNVWRRLKTSVFKVAPRKSLCPKLYIYIYTHIYISYLLNQTLCVTKRLYNLHLCLQPWFWCTWPIHGAIMFMNRPKERTLQTMNSEIAQLRMRPCGTSCFCSIKKIFMWKMYLTCCQLITLIQVSCLIKDLNMMHHSFIVYIKGPQILTIPAEFSSNPNQTHLNMLTRVFKIIRKSQVGKFDQVGAKLCSRLDLQGKIWGTLIYIIHIWHTGVFWQVFGPTTGYWIPCYM